MLSSDWLMKGVFFYQFFVFSAFPPLPGYLRMPRHRQLFFTRTEIWVRFWILQITETTTTNIIRLWKYFRNDLCKKSPKFTDL